MLGNEVYRRTVATRPQTSCSDSVALAQPDCPPTQMTALVVLTLQYDVGPLKPELYIDAGRQE
jgi:hypothetical protein